MIWLIKKIRNKLVMKQKYKYAWYLLDLERKLKKLFNVKR
jgi:hypothetical protein